MLSSRFIVLTLGVRPSSDKLFCFCALLSTIIGPLIEADAWCLRRQGVGLLGGVVVVIVLR